MENFMKRLLCVVLSMAILGSVDTKPNNADFRA